MDILEEINNLKEAFDALFEVSGTEEDEKKQNVNKIKREKKVGPGKEPTEIVSVADELFPYEGSAKEQFNQKVIAKINDMIEGTATLEDLINLVRQKKAPVREGLEGVEDIIKMMEEMINEKVTVAKWVEAAKKAEGTRAEEAGKQLAKYFASAGDNDKEVHNAVHRQLHAKAVSKLAPTDDSAQDVREIHRAAIQPLRKKVDRGVKAGKDTSQDVQRLEKAQEIAGVRPDSNKYVS